MVSTAKYWAFLWVISEARSSVETLSETSHDQTLNVEGFCGVILSETSYVEIWKVVSMMLLLV